MGYPHYTGDSNGDRICKAWHGAPPEIVCLCGSTRFYDEFRRQNLLLTLAGKIVLSIGCDTKTDAELGLLEGERSLFKPMLDELHKRKIDLADRVLVISRDGYLGESTRSEIAYALEHGVPVTWMEPAAEANWNAVPQGQADV